MQPFIRITRHPYEEPYHINLVVCASNGRLQGEIEIYANAADLTQFASKLNGFPKHDDDIAMWELGSELSSGRCAFHFRVLVFQIARNGRCAIELRFCNNEQPPMREITEFSIEALPADLHRLAALLEMFGKLEHRVLEWKVTDGELRLET